MNLPLHTARQPRVLAPGQGRRYDMGRMQALFLADRDETDTRYSISEWWLEPRTPGPGTHAHADDHVFYVLAGTLTVNLAGEWTEVPRGGSALIPGSTPHDFQNRGTERCGFLSINVPGGFEDKMPGIVEHFAARPLTELAGR